MNISANNNSRDDYIRLLVHKVNHELSMYEPDPARLELVHRLLDKIMAPGSKSKNFYILSHTKELRRMGKYLLYISKKFDDRQISYTNLQRNISDDSEFIKKELLSFLSDPPPKERVEFPRLEDNTFHVRNTDTLDESNHEKFVHDDDDIVQDDVDETPSKIFMSLIQSGEHDDEKAFELPGNDLPETSGGKNEAVLQTEEDVPDEEEALMLPGEEKNSRQKNESKKDSIEEEIEVSPVEGSFVVKRKLTFGFDEDNESLITGEKLEEVDEKTEEKADHNKEHDVRDIEDTEEKIQGKVEDDEKRIAISNEMSDEIDEYIRKSETEPLEADEDDEIASAEFLEYENEVRICNSYLSGEMSKFANNIHMARDVRSHVVASIIETSQLLAERSRSMSFELISRIYEAIYLSFEKISEGKYDISESTVSLLVQGLELVESLIKGEDYFVYKSALKSLENIRANLLQEKREREEFKKKTLAKEQIQKELNVRYPSKEQKQIVNSILHQVKNIESVFKEVISTEGDFHTFESLKSIAGSFNSFKSIVVLSKELNIPLLARLSEAGYNFVKYLSNYKKDPASAENREVLEYLIYSLKSVLLGRQADDTETFISYLNDPIKIYEKQTEHQKNPQQR